MLPIRKLPEPPGLRFYKQKAVKEAFQASYERDGNSFMELNIDEYSSAEKETASVELRKQLILEQKSACVYCGQILPDDVLKMKTEHFEPKNGPHARPSLELEYTNLLACCLGGQQNKGDNYCDSAKKDTPLKHLQNPVFINTRDRSIEYKVQRHQQEVWILSDQDDKDSELNKILNLNAQYLRSRRYSTWERAVYRELGQDEPRWAVGAARRLRSDYAQLIDNRHREFKDFILWYLDEWLRKFAAPTAR